LPSITDSHAKQPDRQPSVFSRREVPEACLNVCPKERAEATLKRGHSATPRGEQGKPGARCTRSPCAKVESTRVVTTGSPGHPAFPCAMVLTVSSGLSLVTGLVCHHRRLKFFFCQLDASVGASGPHGFAVRRTTLSSLAPPASTASRPASLTIASRPSPVGRDGKNYAGDLGRK
jgi:hypothetical protein